MPVSGCEGAILAHAVRVGGERFRKGRLLGARDAEALRAAGIGEVVVARPGPDDVAEDEAAEALAARAGGPGARARRPFGGRANLVATGPGIARVDPAQVDRCNGVSEGITVATVAPGARVEEGSLLATVKIIPFAVPRADLEEAAARAGSPGPLLAVDPFRPLRVAHVLTRLPDTPDKLLALSEAGVRDRIEDLGGEVRETRTVAHRTGELAGALRSLAGEGLDLVLVSGASAIVDRRDVVPAAVGEAGGRVDHFGMPVDPGNLLLLGTLGEARVVGLPGCARSPKRNGLDLVLERLAAGGPLGPDEVMGMGAGGLFKEARPRGRRDGGTAPARAARVAAVVLAAGESRRMEGSNKLLEEVGGAPLVRAAAAAAAASEADPVIVVTGHDGAGVERALDGLGVRTVANPNYVEGLSSSLRAGLRAVPEGHDGAVVLLGDMPAVDAGLLDRMLAAFDPVEGRAIVAAAHGGRRGNPVLFARQFFADIDGISGDAGAKAVVEANEESVFEVESATDAPLVDLDTRGELEAWRRRAAGSGEE